VFLISRHKGGGMQHTVKASDADTVIHWKVVDFYEDHFGRATVKLGIIADRAVKHDRHEAMLPEAFVIEHTLSDSDKQIISEWAERGGTKMPRDD
jgi:hypothetical protein